MEKRPDTEGPSRENWLPHKVVSLTTAPTTEEREAAYFSALKTSVLTRPKKRRPF